MLKLLFIKLTFYLLKRLWANIHKKQERIKHGSGERMRKPGSKGAPTAANLKAAGKTESVTEGGRLDLSSPEEKAARKAYIKAKRGKQSCRKKAF